MLEKLICPQCGGNDLNLFGSSAYKCAACGTILAIDEKAAEPSHSAPPPKTEFMTSEERYGDEYVNDKGQKMMDGDTFVKLIVLVAVLALAIFAAVYIINGKI